MPVDAYLPISTLIKEMIVNDPSLWPSCERLLICEFFQGFRDKSNLSLSYEQPAKQVSQSTNNKRMTSS
jgi:hypothetical protein